MRVPSAAALIVGGAAIAVAPGVPSLALDPELVLMAFLPPLLMSGGWFTAWVDFRANLAAIGLLAVGAVALPRPHDGNVSVAATRAASMRDHLVLPVGHTFMLRDRLVANATIAFLASGHFPR